jgi:kynurenine formamidase
MKATFHIGQTEYTADLTKPLDISIPLSPDGPRAWYVDRMIIRSVVDDGFVGSVAEGGSVNFRNIMFNPHGHGTHTESYEHVADVSRPIGQLLKKYFFSAQVISITPEQRNEAEDFSAVGDLIITVEQLRDKINTNSVPEALVIRTLPNVNSKLNANYSDSNFCYLKEDALAYLAEIGVQHLLVDLPSVDREHDGGKLAGHKAFWKNGDASRHDCTISEFIFVKNEIEDGLYLLEMQIAPFVNDAAPSRPVLYSVISDF